ncbi:hypothetical protein BH10PSE19_BH10PSE19_03440 [soil metagenome]
MNIAELIVIFIVALLVLGPQRIMRVAYILGRGLRAWRHLATAQKMDVETQWRREKLQRHIAEATVIESQPTVDAGHKNKEQCN